MFEILVISFVVGALGLASVSVAGIRDAAMRPCNGEQKQLAHLDYTIEKFNRVVKQISKPDGTMKRSKVKV